MAQSTIPGRILAEVGAADLTASALGGRRDFVLHTADASRDQEVDVIAIGPGTPQPLATARRQRRARPDAQVVFLVPEDRLERFRTMLAFDPELGDAWTAATNASPQEIRRVLHDAIQVARERRRMAELADRVNQLLDRPPAIDERERRDQRLRLSEAYLGRLLLQAPDPIFATTPEGDFVAWNDAAAAVFGRPEDAAHPISFLDRVPEAHRPKIAALIRRAAKGEAVPPYDLHLEGADGQGVDLELGMAPIVESSRGTVYVSCIGRDVTARRRAEEQLRSALAEKEVLLREVHHRVKNNLQVITSLLRLRARSLPPESSSPFLESVARIQAMAHLHDRLSASENFVTIPFAPFLRDLCFDLAQAFGMEDQVEFRIDDTPVTFDLESATPIALILAEILTNALKHAFPAGRKGFVTITGRATDAGTELTIHDNGVGIPPGQNPARAGSLGLKVVQALTRQIGGSLNMSSGNGTTVTLTIPAGGARTS